MNDPYREDLPGNKRDKSALELGYQSDSENDSDSKNDKNQDESDDMFADGDSKKDANLLDMEQFVQEQSLDASVPESKVYGKAEVEQLQDYYTNLENSGGKKNLPEVQLEAFNLQEEADHGTFDKDMNYTREDNSDEETREDAWMSGLKTEDIQKAKEAQERQLQALKKTEVRETSDLLQSMVDMLQPAETTLEAFARLRPKKKKGAVIFEDEEKRRKAAVYELTECCEQLTTVKGVRDVYDMSREELMRMYTRETGRDIEVRGKKRKAEDGEYGEAIWEFRWLGEDEVNGPYSAYEMKYWVDSYFENRVEVRRTGADTFVHVQNVHFDEQ